MAKPWRVEDARQVDGAVEAVRDARDHAGHVRLARREVGAGACEHDAGLEHAHFPARLGDLRDQRLVGGFVQADQRLDAHVVDEPDEVRQHVGLAQSVPHHPLPPQPRLQPKLRKSTDQYTGKC